MLNFIILQSPDPERKAFILTNLLILAASVLITWAPSFAIRRWVFKEPVPRWVGILVAFLTFLLGMVVGSLLPGQERPGTHAIAAILAYSTVTRKGATVHEGTETH